MHDKMGLEFVICISLCNGLLQYPISDAWASWNPKVNANTIDYLMGSPSLQPVKTYCTISSKPVGVVTDHANLYFNVRMAAKWMYMLRKQLGMLNTNLLGKRLKYIVVVEYIMLCLIWILTNFPIRSHTRVVKVIEFHSHKCHFPH